MLVYNDLGILGLVGFVVLGEHGRIIPILAEEHGTSAARQRHVSCVFRAFSLMRCILQEFEVPPRALSRCL